jgi:hypothetical protein
MKTKQTYTHPEMELIQLDNDISLQLASDADPMGEPTWSNNSIDYFPNDPLQEFKA